MSSKKGNRKAAASAAAHAASKRKTSAIEISADNESRVRDALKVCCLCLLTGKRRLCLACLGALKTSCICWLLLYLLYILSATDILAT